MNKTNNQRYKFIRLIPALVFVVFFITAAVFSTGCGAVDETEMPENGAVNISTSSTEPEMPTPIATPVPTEDMSPVILTEAVFSARAHILSDGAAVKSVGNLGSSTALFWTEKGQEKLG